MINLMKIVLRLQDKYFVHISLENAEIGWLISSHCAILCVIYLLKGVEGRQILLKLCVIVLVLRNHALLLVLIIIHYLFLLFVYKLIRYVY